MLFTPFAATNTIPWRNNSLTNDGGSFAVTNVTTTTMDLSGGYYDGEPTGYMKSTVITAFATTMLSWSYLTFQQVRTLDVRLLDLFFFF